MSEDNVVNFPTTSAEAAVPIPVPAGPSTEDIERKAAQGQQVILSIIDKNRKSGLEALKKRVENLTDVELADDPKVESRLRDLQQGLGGTLSTLEALNNLVEYIKHDLISCIKTLEKAQIQQYQVASHLQTLIQLLVEKGDISHQEMEEVFNRIVPGDGGAVTAEVEGSEPGRGPTE